MLSGRRSGWRVADVTVQAEIQLKTGQMLAELRKIPGVTEQEVQRMTSAVRAGYARHVREAEKSSKAQAKAFQKGVDEIKASAEKLGSMLGGPFGAAADLALDLGTKIQGTAGAIGGLGAAAAGGVVAVGAIASSMKALSDRSVEALDRLEEVGKASTIPAAAQSSVRAYEAATVSASSAVDRMTVLVGAGLAPAFTTLAQAGVAVADAFEVIATEAYRSGSSINAIVESAQTMIRINLAVTTLGISEALIAMAGSADEAAESVDALADSQERLDQRLNAAQSMVAIQERALLAMTGATDEQIRMAQEMDKIDRITAEYVATLDRTVPAENALATAAEQSAEIYKELIVRKEAAERVTKRETKATQDNSAAQAKAAADAARLARASEEAADQTAALTTNLGGAAFVVQGIDTTLPPLTTKWERASAAVQGFAEQANAITQSAGFTASFDLLGNVAELQSVLHEQSTAELQDRIDKRREEIEAFRDGELERIDAMQRAGTISGQEAARRRQEVLAEAQARREAMRQRTADEREAALKSFRAGQALAVSTAIIDAAAAALALIPAFLFLGPLAPVGAAASAGLALTAQLATIRAQKPPEFAMGRAPLSADHTQLAALQPTEAVLSQRGVATLGGASAVQAANDGRMLGGSVVLQLDRRTLAEVVLATGQSTMLDPRRGKRDPWGGSNG